MSYSFQIRAATKALALAAVAAKFDEIVAGQPVHAADRTQAQAAVDSFINLLPDDETKDVSVNVSGYVSGHWSGSELERLNGANVSAGASLVDRPADPA